MTGYEETEKNKVSNSVLPRSDSNGPDNRKLVCQSVKIKFGTESGELYYREFVILSTLHSLGDRKAQTEREILGHE